MNHFRMPRSESKNPGFVKLPLPLSESSTCLKIFDGIQRIAVRNEFLHSLLPLCLRNCFLEQARNVLCQVIPFLSKSDPSVVDV